MGFRPLVLGQIGDHSYVVASETCALDLVGARYVREVEPGEMLIFSGSQMQSVHFKKDSKKSFVKGRCGGFTRYEKISIREG
jgi:glutamine phosphoribosylpyrophosphate amidotransferase